MLVWRTIPTWDRLAAKFAALCDLAVPCGLTINIEFMPWTTIPDLVCRVRALRADIPVSVEVPKETLARAVLAAL